VSQTNDIDFERFFRTSRSLMVVSDASGIYRLVNEASRRILGYAPDELVGVDYMDLVHPDDEARTREATVAVMVAGATLDGFQNRIRCKDGSYRHIRWHAGPTLDGEWYGEGEDVTGSVEATEALLVQRDIAAAAERVAHMGSWRMDLATGRLDWSDGMYTLFGIDRARFSGDVTEVTARAIHPDDRPMIDEINRLVALDGVPRPARYRILLPDGAIRWVDAQGARTVTRPGAW